MPLEGPYPGFTDVGAFQAWERYTPQPPANLTAAFVPGAPARVVLDWNASIDDSRIENYFVYRSESPTFPPATAMNSYAWIPSGMNTFEDTNLVQGVTYYYQVRAYAGQVGPYPPVELLSVPTNTASAGELNNPPVAHEQSLTTNQNSPLAITLDAWDADGDALTYAVVSGPAHGSLSGNAPNLTYSPALDYYGPDSFSFIADDGESSSAPATVTIAVNAPPVANAGADQSGLVGQALSFSGAASFDPDGTITTYIWMWDDGPPEGHDGIAVATHTYMNPGTYHVMLIVLDNDGASDVARLTVTVNAPPVANAGADQSGNIGQVLTFSAAASYDTDGTITFYSWNWGDNTGDRLRPHRGCHPHVRQPRHLCGHAHGCQTTTARPRPIH